MPSVSSWFWYYPFDFYIALSRARILALKWNFLKLQQQNGEEQQQNKNHTTNHQLFLQLYRPIIMILQIVSKTPKNKNKQNKKHNQKEKNKTKQTHEQFLILGWDN